MIKGENKMKKNFKNLGLVVLAFLLIGGLAACGSGGKASNSSVEKVKIGVVGSDTDVWDTVVKRLKKKNIEVELVKFTDYTQPNAALAEGEIDLNAFQHQIFLDNYNKEHGTKLVSIGNTVNSPLGLYSQKIKKVSQIKKGDTIAIPNDTTNGGRALRLLQTAGLIKVDEAKGYTPTVEDITENKLNLKITELDAAQTARALGDVTASVINGGMAVDAGLNPSKDAIYLEPVDGSSKPYVNIIVANEKDKNKKVYQEIVKEYQTKATKEAIKETSKGANVAAWETFGKK